MTILCRCHWNQWEVKAFVQREAGAFSSKVLRSWSGFFVWKLSSNSCICSSLFSSFPSLASCTAFKTKLWKIFKHLIWHQGKNSSADGRETLRKKKVWFFFLFLDWEYNKSLDPVWCTVIQHVFCCEMTSGGWGVRMEFQLIPWNYADYLRCQMYMCQGAFESLLLVRSFFKSGCLGPFA